MRTLWAIVHDAQVQITTPIDLHRAYARLQANGFPPLFSLSDSGAPTSYRLIHRIRAGRPKISLDRRQHTMVLACAEERLGDGEALLHLASLLLERQLQLKGFMSMLAACVHLPAGAALLLGSIGAGKTSTAMALCLDHHASLIGNDLCLIGLRNGIPIASMGSPNFFVRYDAVHRNRPDLLRLFAQLPADGWTSKLVVSPATLGVHAGGGPVVIVGAYVIHADDRSSAVCITDVDTARIRYSLYENLSRLLCGSAEPLLVDNNQSFGAYVPNLDSAACYRERVRLINTLIEHIGVVHVTGTASGIAGWIAADVARRANDTS